MRSPKLKHIVGLTAALLSFTSFSALAVPVLHQISLTAVSGSQFGVSAPAIFTGTFSVDSVFLQQPDGFYAGENVSGFSITIGTQTFDAATAYDPNIQGVILVDHKIIGLGMNWSQTSLGLAGPFLQMAGSGYWVSGSTAHQAGSLILQGADGTQKFSLLPSACVGPLIADGGSQETAVEIGIVAAEANPDGSWTVTYQTTGSWLLTELHLDVACDQGGFPLTKKGNPAVGEFAYSSGPIAPTDNYTFLVEAAGCCSQLIAAHAVVVDTADCVALDEVEVCREESAWAAGVSFPGKNWATYFTCDGCSDSD